MTRTEHTRTDVTAVSADEGSGKGQSRRRRHVAALLAPLVMAASLSAPAVAADTASASEPVPVAYQVCGLYKDGMDLNGNNFFGSMDMANVIVAPSESGFTLRVGGDVGTTATKFAIDIDDTFHAEYDAPMSYQHFTYEERMIRQPAPEGRLPLSLGQKVKMTNFNPGEEPVYTMVGTVECY